MTNLRTVARFCILASTIALSSSLVTMPATAHDAGHGGGGGDHGGGFSGADHGGGFEGGGHDGFTGGERGAFEMGDHDGFRGDRFEGHDGAARDTARISGRFRHDGYFFDNFGNEEDECYPEWAYDRDEHPFRSDVCAD